MKSFSAVLIISLVSFTAFGQAAYTFKVIANKGANQVKSGENVSPVKAGASLKESDELIIAENAYLGLVSSGGKPLELKKSGNYKVADLAAQVKSGSSVVNKYTDFILSSNAESKKNRLSATGAVHRATETSAIKLMLPDQNSGVFGQTALINWAGENLQGPFVLTVKNMFEDKLDQFETPETSMQIDLSKYKGETAVLIKVVSKDNPKMASRDYTISKLSPADQEKISKQMEEMKGEASEENALNYFIMAGFFEQNNLIVDAIGAFDKAVKMEPSYKEYYDEFLVRNGLQK